MRLIVGLGNPGRQYAGTRHNVGFDVVETLAERLGWVPEGEFDRVARTRFDALMFAGVFTAADGSERKLVLMKPSTFMNLSGRSVQQAAGFYKVEPAAILVACDDLALPVGRLRVRADGSDGGHNGLKDVARALGTTRYPRLRIGVGSAPPHVAGRDYVLGVFDETQRRSLDLGRAAGCCLTWADRGVTAAMNQFNAASPDAGPDEGTAP